ncbi:division/cell wall cluster transcriptional repressor MraZ [Candidatus Dojkabacteria bacterium]|nr:division/cell wall cluster transcriptional repressor MraZ [Candidatus Dojkabacteria bacterium]
MLIGEYRNRLGEKNRLALPIKFREELGDNIIVTRGYESSLIIVDKKLWENLLKEFGDRAFAMSLVRDTRRFLIGGAYEIDLDKQGRFVLPESLKEYAGVKEEAVFVGLEDWIEVWDFDKWEKKLNELKLKAGEIAESIYKVRPFSEARSNNKEEGNGK